MPTPILRSCSTADKVVVVRAGVVPAGPLRAAMVVGGVEAVVVAVEVSELVAVEVADVVTVEVADVVAVEVTDVVGDVVTKSSQVALMTTGPITRMPVIA